jgi:hypothetical protein
VAGATVQSHPKSPLTHLPTALIRIGLIDRQRLRPIVCIPARIYVDDGAQRGLLVPRVGGAHLPGRLVSQPIVPFFVLVRLRPLTLTAQLPTASLPRPAPARARGGDQIRSRCKRCCPLVAERSREQPHRRVSRAPPHHLIEIRACAFQIRPRCWPAMRNPERLQADGVWNDRRQVPSGRQSPHWSRL